MSHPKRWVHRRGALDLERPVVMGVLNRTPDSFSDGGLFLDEETAIARAEAMARDGAGIIDLGGESTRPGADPVDPEEEAARIVPLVRALRERTDVVLSVDTRRASVAEAALAAGADVINDVSALRDPRMAGVVVAAGAGLVLMHMRGTPRTMQIAPHFDDVAAEVVEELRPPLQAATDAGIAPDRIVVDPGIGFAKGFDHNLELISRLRELRTLGHPMLLGVSRKAFLGALLGGVPPERRDVATAAACICGLYGGARIFRVHDVALVTEALTVADAIRTAGGP